MFAMLRGISLLGASNLDLLFMGFVILTPDCLMVAYEKGACDTVLFVCKERLHVLEGCFREGLHVGVVLPWCLRHQHFCGINSGVLRRVAM